jgi:hypothetical protein
MQPMIRVSTDSRRESAIENGWRTPFRAIRRFQTGLGRSGSDEPADVRLVGLGGSNARYTGLVPTAPMHHEEADRSRAS